MVSAFKGNKAETKTMLPVIESFMAAHELPDVLVEKSFRMSKSDLQGRPIYHRKRDSIEAHLTIVFAALAVSPWIEAQTGLVHQEVRQDRTTLPRDRDQSRTARHHRRRPAERA